MKWKMIVFFLLTLLESHTLLGSCFEHLADLIKTHPTKEFKLIISGEKSRNSYTRMYSVAEDLKIKVEDDADIKSIAKLIEPRDEQKRKLIEQTLKAKFDEGHREVSLRLLAPEAVSRLTNQTPKCDGPNCFNATLNWFYPELGVRVTAFEEITNYLNTHFTKLEVGKELSFGDVLVFKTRNGEIVHTSIFLNKEFGWHKGGNSQLYSWNFETNAGIMEMYGRFSRVRAEVEVFRFSPKW